MTEKRQKETVTFRGGTRSTLPYSPAMRYGDLLFVSGQVAQDPATGKSVGGGIVEQTHRVLQNLAELLEQGGSSMGRVLKTTCFLANLDDFTAFNEVYRTYFPEPLPARSTFEVGRLPMGYLVEVEAIAAAG